MSETQEAILANASYHTRLLTTIGHLEYVPSAKKHQINYIEDLEGQLASIQKEVAQLAEKTKKERKEHETLRDSTGRRFAHKLLGKAEKFEAKANKEEREYVEALEREMIARNNQASVQQLLQEARNELVNLTEKEHQLQSVNVELTALYARVFDGPTESFPEDDRLEYDLHAEEKRYDQIQATLNSESRAAESLARAVRFMDACQGSMQEALGYSRYDMWGGGNTMADMMERNALVNAQGNASQVEMLVSQAIRASPRVQPIGRIDIARGSLLSDVFFDNIFTDMAFHNKIKQSAAQVVLYNQRLKAERDNTRRRVDAVGAQLVQASKNLDRCRRELYDFRKATFESYVAQNPPPPSYDVVTTTTTNNNNNTDTTSVKPAAATAITSDIITTNRDNNNTNYNPLSSPSSLVDDDDDDDDDDEKQRRSSLASPLTTSPPRFEVASSSSMTSTSSNNMIVVSPPPKPTWGSRNPYAAAMAERTQHGHAIYAATSSTASGSDTSTS